MSANNTDLFTSFGVAVLAIAGAVAKADQWRNPSTGQVSGALLLSGIATALVMATLVRAAGVHYGIEPWAQCALTGVFCYVGPDPVIRAVAGIALKRFGVSENAQQTNVPKP